MKLILHAGTHKTGTTSIQKALSDNRSWLRQRGLWYPDGCGVYLSTKVPHHRFSSAFTGTSAERLAVADQFLCAARAGLDCPNDVLLISAEPIYRHIAGYDDYQHFNDPDYWLRRDCYLSRLAHAFGDFEVMVLLFFRERESFARSLYGEITRKGFWQGSPTEFQIHFRRWFEYENQIAAFRKVFLKVQTLSYEQASEEGLIKTFFRTIKFPLPPNTEHIWERRTPETIHWTV
jgi:hypothetical protein